MPLTCGQKHRHQAEEMVAYDNNRQKLSQPVQFNLLVIDVTLVQSDEVVTLVTSDDHGTQCPCLKELRKARSKLHMTADHTNEEIESPSYMTYSTNGTPSYPSTFNSFTLDPVTIVSNATISSVYNSTSPSYNPILSPIIASPGSPPYLRV